MSVFSPRRYQPPYYPYTPDGFALRAVAAVEYAIKDVLFSCRMCGNCILQETAFVCPMTCPKGERNGPCGGSTPEHCYVDTTRPCTWYEIYKRAEAMGPAQMDKLLEIQAPVDGCRVGHEAWVALYEFWRKNGKDKGISFWSVLATFNPIGYKTEKIPPKVAKLLLDLRQPDWWKGDDKFHAPAYSEPVSNLERQLRTGQFTVTAEIAPPQSMNVEPMIKRIKLLRDWVVAANYTDNASASPKLSSQAASLTSQKNDLEAVMQLQTRDRNRYGLQSEAMAASLMGVRNILCLTGDHLRLGPPPNPAAVQNDMDAIMLIWMLRRMRDEKVYLDGREIKTPPVYFLGAAASPYAALPRYEARRTEKKVNAGAQFIQTQPIFDYNRFVEWMEAIDKRNLVGKTYILAGLTPLKGAKTAHYMAEEVPGVVVPPEIVKRLDNTKDEKEEGVAIALELIEKIKKTPGVSGIHIMPVFWEEIVPRLVKDGGLPLPLRAPAAPAAPAPAKPAPASAAPAA